MHHDTHDCFVTHGSRHLDDHEADTRIDVRRNPIQRHPEQSDQ